MYVEAVVLDNLVVDACLLFFVLKTLRQKVNKWGMIVACAFGVGFALSAPLLIFDGILGVLVKLAQAFLMSVMLDFSFNKVLLKTGLLLLYTFLFGGMLYAVFNFFGVSTVSGMFNGYISSYPLGAIFAVLLLMGFMLFVLIKRLLKNKKIKDLCLPVMLQLNGKRAVVTGFCDSGNLLRSKSGKPVVMLNSNSLNHWFNSEEQIRLLLHKPPTKAIGYEPICINNANSKNMSFVFNAEKCVLNGTSYDVCVGVFKTESHVFDVILNSCMVV